MIETIFLAVLWLTIGATVAVKLFGDNLRNRRSNRRRNAAGRSYSPGRSNSSGAGSTTSVRSGNNETGMVIYYANNPHGLADKEYRFNYRKVGNDWRAYILKTPGFGLRATDGHTTHRKFDITGPYVCWDRPVATLADIQSISKVWADCIQEYIATGRTFG